ncbi:MAG: beta-galactosidase trimerization domain-containing protein [Victivallaceae bacterium]|nr:beta-galactosidase trimerization domain-containing protein [Victivallaceae bacterium]
MNIEKGEITIEAWVKPESYQGRGPAIVNKYSATGGFLLSPWHSFDYKTFFFLRNNAKVFRRCSPDLPLALNKWSHIAGIKDKAGTMRIYVNGVEQIASSKSCPFSFASLSTPLYIGRYSGTFHGIIDEVRISNIARKEYLGPDGKLIKYRNRDAVAFQENPHLAELNSEVITPHISWADPYYQGKMKALIFCPVYKGTRDLVELAQRLSLEITPILTGGYTFGQGTPNSWWACLPESVLVNLARKGLETHPNLIFINGLNWQSIPEDLRISILKEVANGAGLLYINPLGLNRKLEGIFKEKVKDKKDFILSGIPLTELPLFNKYADLKDAAEKIISLGAYGKGRVAKLTYPAGGYGLLPDTAASKINYEYYQSFLIRTILWITRREPSLDVRIRSLPALFQNNLASSALDVKLDSPQDRCPVSLVLNIYDEHGALETENIKSTVLHQGVNIISFKFPFLKEGKHFADLLVKNRNKEILNWASTSLKVNSEIKIADIVLKQDYYQLGKNLNGKIILNKIPAKELTLKLELEDTWGRLIKAESLKTKSKETPFACSFSSCLSLLVKVKSKILSGTGEVISEKVKEIPVLKEDNGEDIKVIVWALGLGETASDTFLADLSFSELRKYGADAIELGGHLVGWMRPGKEELFKEMSHNLARHNLRIFPYITRIAPLKEVKDFIRVPCLTDPDYRAKLKDLLIERTKGCCKYTPLAYSLGDENHLLRNMEGCFSPTCRKGFRKYLKGIYADLTVLNKEWDTNYKTWDEIRPLTLKEAKERKNLPAWIDHCLFMETVFADIHNFGRNVIRSVDKKAKVGFDGATTSVFRGYDWFKMTRAADLCLLYEGEDQEEAVRSFAKKGSICGIMSGGYDDDYKYKKDRDFQCSIPWDQLFRGFNTMMLWHALPAERRSIFRGDISVNSWFKWVIPEIKEIKQGTGKLLLNSERETDRIGIHYSQSSLHATKAFSDLGSNIASRENFSILLRDLGLQYDFVAYEQIEKGRLAEAGYKILILPYSLSISKKEAEQITEFVNNGGLLIADIRPGLLDGHGKQLAGGLLDSVFGVKRKNNQLTSQNAGLKDLADAVCDPELEVAGAVALRKSANIPLLMVNNYGKGRTIYLNFLMNRYLDLRSSLKGEKLRNLMKTLFKDYGDLESRVKITASGKEPSGYFRSMFKNGKAEYVGIIKTLKPGKDQVEINFPYKSHLYDVREKKYYGFTDKISVEMPYKRGRLYALMPYKIEKLNLSNIKDIYNPGEIINYQLELKVSTGIPSGHVFRLEIYNPNGQICECYSKNLLAENGKYSGNTQLALNDRKGLWKVTVKDTVSGEKAEKLFRIK